MSAASPPLLRQPLSERLQAALTGWSAPELVRWSCAAASAFEAQLRDTAGVTHREVARPISEWLGFTPSEHDAIGDSLDLLQVAFDLADNISDAEEDRRLGRGYNDAYAEIPKAVCISLPAYLIATACESLRRCFEPSGHSVSVALGNVHQVLGSMLLGQSMQDPVRKAELVSGSQARLLCLPAWLRTDHPLLQPNRLEGLHRWAESWGTSWQLGFEFAEQRTAHLHALWLRSTRLARAEWPPFGPFVPGQTLAADQHLTPLC